MNDEKGKNFILVFFTILSQSLLSNSASSVQKKIHHLQGKGKGSGKGEESKINGFSQHIKNS